MGASASITGKQAIMYNIYAVMLNL